MTTPDQTENRSQAESLRVVPVNQIPHGTHIPLEIFTKYFPGTPDGQLLLELGGGGGSTAKKLSDLINAAVMLLDINPGAVAEAKSKGITARQADVRQGEIYPFSFANLELFPGIYAEGLLCNQTGNDWRKVLQVADLYLRPGGIAIISDIFRIDTPNKKFRASFDKVAEYQLLMKLWQRRYAANMNAAKMLGIALKYGDFMVAKPGEAVSLEWGNMADLLKLHKSEQFERFASHLNPEAVIRYVNKLGLKVVAEMPQVFLSRIKSETQPNPALNGRILVLQKGDRFKYHPYYHGLTVPESRIYASERRRLARTDPDYVSNAIVSLKQNLPNWQDLFPMLEDPALL